jgi:general secretion pathway protein E
MTLAPAANIIERLRESPVKLFVDRPQSLQLSPDLVSSRFRNRIPRDFARQHLVISQGESKGRERVAMAQSSDSAAIFNVGVSLGAEVETVLADPESIANLIDVAYGSGHNGRGHDEATEKDTIETPSSEIDHLLAFSDRDLLATSGKAPLIKLVDALLFEALQRKASDVHIQPLADRTLIRFRFDGVLHTVRELPPRMTPPLVSRIKVMGKMDIAERRVPQDGRSSVTIGKRSIDLRISTLPTSYGERAVIRLLDNAQQLCDFDKLGMPSDVAHRFLSCASRSCGIILVTGPTGSGKTTTLYSTLGQVASPGVNIMTIEDPIEYELSTVGLAISQSQVNLRKGVNFATGLRHILRQDPDIVMVGEIRDQETARTAIQSSLTGHLVFSTLHTNDAPSAVTRLIDLGIEPYLVAASLSAVLAQRLVRIIHVECQGRGCGECLGTGFRGRSGLFELMVIDELLRGLISRNVELSEIRQQAKTNGLRTLHQHGTALIKSRQTTPAEVERVVAGAA